VATGDGVAAVAAAAGPRGNMASATAPSTPPHARPCAATAQRWPATPPCASSMSGTPGSTLTR
jgi:hypothetical protein